MCVCGGGIPCQRSMKASMWLLPGSSLCIGAQMHRLVSDRRGCQNSWATEGCLEGARPGPQLVCGNLRPVELSWWQPEGREASCGPVSGRRWNLGDLRGGARSAAVSPCPELPATDLVSALLSRRCHPQVRLVTYRQLGLLAQEPRLLWLERLGLSLHPGTWGQGGRKGRGNMGK